MSYYDPNPVATVLGVLGTIVFLFLAGLFLIMIAQELSMPSGSTSFSPEFMEDHWDYIRALRESAQDLRAGEG